MCPNLNGLTLAVRCCRLRTPQSSNVPPPLTAGGDLQRAPSNRVGRDSRAMTREEKTRLNDFRALQYEMELKIKATQQMEKEMQGLKVERELATTELTNLRRRLASVEQERDRLHDELEQANARLGKLASCAPLPRSVPSRVPDGHAREPVPTASFQSRSTVCGRASRP